MSEVWFISCVSFWSYSLSKLKFKTFQTVAYYQIPLSVASLKQLLANFLQQWEVPRPCCCYMPNFYCRSCHKHWILTRSHPLYSDSEFLCIFSGDTSDIFLGLWCRYQWNAWVLSSTLVVFVHCVVLKVELLFPMSFTKCDASTQHDAILDWIREAMGRAIR